MSSADLPVGDPAEPGDPSLHPVRAPLQGEHVRLEPLDPKAYAEQLFACSNGDLETEGLWTYMPYGPFEDLASMRAWLDPMAGSSDPSFFAVVDEGSAAAVGVTSFLNIDPVMRHLELGHIWYGPQVQRTKVNTEAVYLMLRHSFDDLHYRRVEWKCDSLNARSRAAALRLGFTFEGIFRKHMIYKGRNRDTAWYAMLEEDWPLIGANMREWLNAVPGTLSLAEMNGVSKQE